MSSEAAPEAGIPPARMPAHLQFIDDQIKRRVVHSSTLVSLRDSNVAEDRPRFSRALSSFQARNGTIVKWETVPRKASLILTESRRWEVWKPAVRLFLEYERTTLSDRALGLVDAQFHLVRRAEQRVRRSDRIIFVGDLASLIWSTIEDDYKAHDVDLTGHAHSRMAEIERQIERATERSLQLTYLAGMGWVSPFLVVLALGLGAALRRADLNYYEFHTFVSALIAGALGAFVSVLGRMSRGRIWLTPDLGLRWARILGSIRPFLGVVFAALAYYAFTGEVIGISLPGGNGNYWALAIVGFFAGFSERFARDMLVVTQRGVGISSDPEDGGEKSGTATQELGS